MRARQWTILLTTKTAYQKNLQIVMASAGVEKHTYFRSNLRHRLVLLWVVMVFTYGADVSFAQSGDCTDLLSAEDSINRSMKLAEDVVRHNNLPAPLAARLYAINSIALHDAYKISHLESGYFLSLPHLTQKSENVEQVQINASLALLEMQHPLSSEIFKRFKEDICLGGESSDALLGRDIGELISKQSPPPAKSKIFDEDIDGPGEWVTTPPYYSLPVLPLWAIATPFELAARDSFRPAGPPPITSAAFRASLAQVQRLGGVDSSIRTQDQTEIALFWADGRGTSSGPGHWNDILRRTDKSAGTKTRLQNLLLLNISMYDAGIAAWDAKYSYKFWRPLTAIMSPSVNSGQTETAWQPLIENPAHPEYVSGHSSFSAAAATVLQHRLGDIPFCTTSEGLPGAKRCFTSFQAASQEAGDSRIYGGIHFSFSNEDGLKLGREVADWVITSFRQHHGIE